MLVAARRATSADSGELSRLFSDARDALALERGGAIFVGRELQARAEPGFFDDLVGDDDALVVVGTLDAIVVGMAVARMDHLRTSEPIVRFDLLWVEPEAREVGVGEAIINFLASWAADRGAIGMDAFALPGNREAKNLFERTGFVARLLVMHRPNTQSESPR